MVSATLHTYGDFLDEVNSEKNIEGVILLLATQG
jgi:hypothetical protein